MLDNEELEQIIGSILRKWFSASDLKDLSITSGEDHDGDPALFITARFRTHEQQFDASSLLDNISEIRAELRRRGDPRLPYVRYETPDLLSEAIG